jgi:ketosteroid isomerase-like protein
MENAMSEENKQLIRRWFEEVWNNGSAEAIDDMFDEKGIAYGLSDDPANPITGPGDFKPFHKLFREAFPNMMIVVEDVVAEGDKVAARCSVRAKHEGNFMGREATQAPVEFTGITIVRIENGKIVEAWNNFDFMELHKQVGLLA